MLFGSLVAIGALVNTAPLGEVGLMPEAYNNNTANWEGDRPHPLSGHGPYSSCKPVIQTLTASLRPRYSACIHMPVIQTLTATLSCPAHQQVNSQTSYKHELFVG